MTVNISRAQRMILSIGAFLIVAALMFPPWLSVRWTSEGNSYGGRSAGYHFLFVPPDVGRGTYVNTSLLLIEIAALILITGLLFLAARPRSPN
jgi:hypothetical protein